MTTQTCGCTQSPLAVMPQVVARPQFAVEPGTVFVDETTGITAFVDETGTLVVGLPPEEEIVGVVDVASPEGQELLGVILPPLEEELLEPVVTVLEQPVLLAAPAAAPDVPGTFPYVVQPGDTLGAIAATFGTTIDAILAVNPQITDPDLIIIGETINIPEVAGPAMLGLAVDASGNDGNWSSGEGTVFSSVSPVDVLNEFGTGRTNHWLRFTVPIPRESTITRAFIRYRMARAVSTESIGASFRADAVDDAPNPTSSADATIRRDNGTTQSNWEQRWLTFGVGDIVDSFNIAPTIQAVINRPGWREGNHLTLYVRAESRMTPTGYQFRSANDPAGTPPELWIDFVAPVTAATGSMRFIVQDGVTFLALPGATVFFASSIQATGPDGTAVFPDVPVGDYPWTVNAPGHIQQSGTATVLDGEFQFALVRLAPDEVATGDLLVSVRDAATGEGLGSAVVVAAAQTAVTDAGGEAFFPDLREDSYVVTASHGSYEPGTTTVFVPGGGTGQATLLLQRTGVDLQVSVFDVTGGSPPFPTLAGVMITLGAEGQQPTDATGIAVFRDVPVETSMLLAAQRDGFRQTTSQVVTVSAAEAPLALRQVLMAAIAAGTAELRLTVVDLGTGAVIPGAAVELALASGEIVAVAPTDANGLAVFSALVPGDYQVTVEASGFEPASEVISLSDGEVLVIDAPLVRIGEPVPPPPTPGPGLGGALVPLLAAGGVALFVFAGGRDRERAPAATEGV